LGSSWFQASLGKKKKKLIIPHLNGKKLATVVCLSFQLQLEEENSRITVQASLGKNQDLITKITRGKRAGSVAQAVELLLNKYKAQYCQKEINTLLCNYRILLVMKK
jgi:hypothetical protein